MSLLPIPTVSMRKRTSRTPTTCGNVNGRKQIRGTRRPTLRLVGLRVRAALPAHSERLPLGLCLAPRNRSKRPDRRQRPACPRWGARGAAHKRGRVARRPYLAAQLEHRHRVAQRIGLLGKRVRRGRRFLHECRILLRHLVHLRDGGIYLLNTRALLLRRQRNLPDDIRHALNRSHDVRDDLPRVADERRTGIHATGGLRRSSP